MDSQGQENDGVIHFSCRHCLMSLTVADELAGITGPCPSCGGDVAAPLPASSRGSGQEAKAGRKNVDAVTSEGEDQSQSSRGVTERDSPSPHGRSGRPANEPESSMSEARRERAEVASVFKLLVAGLVILAMILAVAYWLNFRRG